MPSSSTKKKANNWLAESAGILSGQHPEADCRSLRYTDTTLEGAAMPAIVIELGYLTNPSDEKKMQSAIHQTHLVKVISDAVALVLDRRLLALIVHKLAELSLRPDQI